MSTQQTTQHTLTDLWTPRPWMAHHQMEATQELEKLLSSGLKDGLHTKVDALIAAGAHPDGPARNGLFLRHAVTRTNIQLLDQLLSHGADPNARLVGERQDVPLERQREPYNNIETVLHWAISRAGFEARRFNASRSLEVMLRLICAGADRQAQSRFGMSCLELAKAEAASSSKSTSARLIPMAIEMPLHVAIELNKPELCLSLLEVGADPSAKNPRKQTAWRAAELAAPECSAAMQAWKSQQLMRDIAIKSDRTKSP